MYDLIIKNGRILDGSGAPWIRADIAIKGDEIVGIGRFEGGNAIDVSDLFVAPGFIDVHSHADFQVFVEPTLKNRLFQGVTTHVIGNCGDSGAPIINKKDLSFIDPFGHEAEISWSSMEDYVQKIKQTKHYTNVATLVGHGRIRHNVMGYQNRKPTYEELEKMKELVAESMQAGALGISTGLLYAPGSYCDTQEIIELCKVVTKYNGIYVTHLRDQKSRLMDSINESIKIGEQANIPIHISHFKTSGKSNWGKIKNALQLINEARNRGIDITVDQYPYTSGHGYLLGSIPGWLQDMGEEELKIRLRQPHIRKKLKEEMVSFEWNSFIITYLPSENKEFLGKNLGLLAEEKGQDPVDFLCDLLLEHGLDIMIISFWGCEEDVREIMKSDLQFVASDGIESPHGQVHPRTYGTFPRIINKYVKEGIISLPEAIRKMTSFPALRFGLVDRGLIKVKNKADLVVFDLKKVKDTATIDQPRALPRGINYIIINGQVIVKNQKIVGEANGQMLTNSLSKLNLE